MNLPKKQPVSVPKRLPAARGEHSPQRGEVQRAEVQRLSRLLDRWSGADRPPAEVVSSGVAPLDAALADRGFRRGWLVEWLADGRGAGAGALMLLAARAALAEGGMLVVVDRAGTVYPPALAAWGIDLSSTLFVLPESERDEAWALDQALRCPHVAAVLAWPRRLEGRAFRRLQLAAEESGALGLLQRPAVAASEPTWAAVRMHVAPRGIGRTFPHNQKASNPPAANSQVRRPVRRAAARAGGFAALRPQPSGPPAWWTASARWSLELSLLRQRGQLAGRTLELELDPRTGACHETDPRRVVAQLAAGATRDQTA